MKAFLQWSTTLRRLYNVLFFSILILTYSLQQSAAANVIFGNPLVPSSGGSAGCWIQVIQQPVTHNEVCIYLLTLHLNQGTQADPPNAFEIRVYEVNQTANVGTLKRQRDVVVDVTNQDQQKARLSSCLMAYKGEYVGIANAQGAMRDTVVSGGSPSWKYWNKFEATSKATGSTITLDSEFGPGSLGWRIDAVNGTTTPLKKQRQQQMLQCSKYRYNYDNGWLSYYNYIYNWRSNNRKCASR